MCNSNFALAFHFPKGIPVQKCLTLNILVWKEWMLVLQALSLIMEIFMLEGTSELGMKGRGNKKGERSHCHLGRCLCCSTYLGRRLLGKGKVFYEEPWF